MKEDEAARNKLSENSATTKTAVETKINEIAETLVKLHILNYLDVDEEGEKRIVEVAVILAKCPPSVLHANRKRLI